MSYLEKSGTINYCQHDGKDTNNFEFLANAKGVLIQGITSTLAALERPSVCGAAFVYDTFLSAAFMCENADGVWKELDTPAGIIGVQKLLCKAGIKNASKRDIIHYLENYAPKINLLENWIKDTTWDGTPRVADFARDYLGADDTRHNANAITYLWACMVQRVTDHNVKLPGASIVLVSPFEGCGITTSLEAMSPPGIRSGHIDLKKAARLHARTKASGCYVLLEAPVTAETLTSVRVKAYLCDGVDYQESRYSDTAPQPHPHRAVIVGTAMYDIKIPDSSRRWLPVRVGRCDPHKIAQDREQLWAEAFVLFNQFGVIPPK